jgi:hypothetical protein
MEYHLFAANSLFSANMIDRFIFINIDIDMYINFDINID